MCLWAFTQGERRKHETPSIQADHKRLETPDAALAREHLPATAEPSAAHKARWVFNSLTGQLTDLKTSRSYRPERYKKVDHGFVIDRKNWADILEVHYQQGDHPLGVNPPR